MSFEANDKLVPGTEVNVGGRNLTVPPLNLRALKELKPEFERAGNGDGPRDVDAEIDASVKIIQRALSRNYPQVTADDILDAVDMALLPRLTALVCGQSGVEGKESGGEPMGESTGGVSTGT